MAELKYGSWLIGSSDEEVLDSLEQLQVRLSEMSAAGWEIQHFSMATFPDGSLLHGYIWRRD